MKTDFQIGQIIRANPSLRKSPPLFLLEIFKPGNIHFPIQSKDHSMYQLILYFSFRAIEESTHQFLKLVAICRHLANGLLTNSI